MKNAYIIDAIRTPFGRYAGGLAPVRADDLGAVLAVIATSLDFSRVCWRSSWLLS
jgi:acetyl-CoA acetyltransferase